jgi:hypothetical protein
MHQSAKNQVLAVRFRVGRKAAPLRTRCKLIPCNRSPINMRLCGGSESEQKSSVIQSLTRLAPRQRSISRRHLLHGKQGGPDVRAKVRTRARGPWRRCVRGPRRTAANRRPDPGSFRPRSLIVPAHARERRARPVGDETSFHCDLARAGAFGELQADPALLTPRVARGEVPMLDGLASWSKKFRRASAQGLSCIRGPCFLHATAKRGEGGAGQKVRCLSLPRHDQGPRRAGRFFGCGNGDNP